MKQKLVFLIVLLVGFFIILPPSLNFGDQSSDDLLFHKQLIEYLKEKKTYGSNFRDYFWDKYATYNQEKLPFWRDYGLASNPEELPVLNPTHHLVFILSGLGQLIIYYLFMGKLGVEACLMIFGLIIFVLTFVYGYKFGWLLVNEKFGLFLAVIATSNIYFNQLVRSMLFPFITIYPLLFFASFYFLLKLHKTEEKSRGRSFLGLSFCLVAAFLNGYPNTNVVLLSLLGLFGVLLVFSTKFLKVKNFTLLPWQKYLKLILFSSFLIFLTSAIWSNLLGEHIFYGLDSILHDRGWGYILSGKPVPNAGYDIHIWQAPFIIINVLKILFTNNTLHTTPHEASFLQDLSYLNLIESIFFIIGLIYLVKRIFKRRIIENFLLFLFGFLVYRIFKDSVSYTFIARNNFDYYFVIVFFVAYGLFVLPKLVSPKRRKLINDLSFLLLGVSLLLNIYIFNKKFVLDFQEGLRQSFGVYQLRQFYEKEMSSDNNLIIYDYANGDGYMYNMNLISFLENKTDYDTLASFFNSVKISSLGSFKSFLRGSLYENVYVILPVGLSPLWGKPVWFEPLYNFHQTPTRLGAYFSYYDPYKVIANRRGIPRFMIYKFSKTHPYYTVDLSQKKDLYEINFDGQEKLDYIDIPGSVEGVEITFGDNPNEILNLDFSKYYFNRFHLSFDSKSAIDITNNFDSNDKLNNIEKNDTISKLSKPDAIGTRVQTLSSTRSPAEIVFNYPVGFPIRKVFFNIPLIFYNDLTRNNEYSLFYKTDKSLNWQLKVRQRSNANLSYEDFSWDNAFETGPVFSFNADYNLFGTFDLRGAKDLMLKYRIVSILGDSIRPYSFSGMPESSYNFLRFEVDTSGISQYQEISTHKIFLKMKYRNEDKTNLYQTLAVGTQK